MNLSRSLVAAFALAASLSAGSVSAADSDRDIGRQLTNDLYRTVAVGPYGLRVRIIHGVVHLTGSVATVRDFLAAQQLALDTEGVSGVKNDLSVLIR